MSAEIDAQRRRVVAAEVEVAHAIVAISAPSRLPKDTLERFTEAEDRHEALVTAEAELLRQQAKLAELENIS